MKKLLIAFLLVASMCGAQTLTVPNFNLTPPGEIKMYGGLTAPSGYLLCDGTLASDTAYPTLSAIIKNQYVRTGDPTDSFRVPDFRGVFPKGFGTNGLLGANYAGASGTPLVDKMQGHYHSVLNGNSQRITAAGCPVGGGQAAAGYGAPPDATYDFDAKTQYTDGTNGTPRIGAITEPANVGVSFIIKY